MEHKPLFTGVCTALITPFRRGWVDEAALRGLVRRKIAAGVHALTVCGTTGESSTLREEEWRRVLAGTLERLKAALP